MIRAIGIDAAFAHMGFCRVVIRQSPKVSGVRFPGDLSIDCTDLRLVSTESENRKVVRKSSDGLRRAQELHAALQEYAEGAQFAFVEVPHGGALSAAAARAMGMAVGILASCPIPIIEVSPMEVKMAVTGSRKGAQASKAEIIQWAFKLWPSAPWMLHKSNGKTFKKGDLQNGNEHLADALAIVVAGIQTPEFQRLLALSNHATPSTPGQRPAPRRIALD